MLLQREEYKRRADNLRQSVKDMLAEVVEELARLELIDMIRKLGMAHLFTDEMQQTLQVVASSRNGKKNGEAAAAAAEELYPTALCFRLMRLHGYKVSQGMSNTYISVFNFPFTISNPF
ncbi:hypothetical protein CCACVL1_06202 [Corchorus capsularis]|uniref:Terpene synthase N-terminal domain-containing protein n=1 Tax=Corchorus capsularis TaxID=210143 RepID=A0A1R3JGX6_COCAP|nr:hypothetical protein CCACVL1_06202 [Corchorus capsularis]